MNQLSDTTAAMHIRSPLNTAASSMARSVSDHSRSNRTEPYISQMPNESYFSVGSSASPTNDLFGWNRPQQPQQQQQRQPFELMMDEMQVRIETQVDKTAEKSELTDISKHVHAGKSSANGRSDDFCRRRPSLSSHCQLSDVSGHSLGPLWLLARWKWHAAARNGLHVRTACETSRRKCIVLYILSTRI